MSALPSDDDHYEPSPAELLAAEGDRWPRGVGKKSQSRFYVIQSRTEGGKAHWTTDYGCTCKGYHWKSKCAHVEAVRLYEAWNPERAWIGGNPDWVNDRAKKAS